MPQPSAGSLQDPGFLERYEIIERVASGGFGDVYRARQHSTHQDVAVKVLRMDAWGGGASANVERFRRETRLCAALQHPNIVRLIDSGEGSGGAVYAVFEFVRGNNLADVLAAEGSLASEEALHLMGQVIDALACAHAQGVVHRDLKPANVMVADSGARRNALVLDFGLGTFTRGEHLTEMTQVTLRGEYLGTPAYSPPEQLLGKPAVPASDLFAWGMMFIECLTGRPAYDGPVPLVIHRQLAPDPVPIPPLLEDHPLGRLLRRVTEKDAAQRAGSAEHVLASLDGVLSVPLPGREELHQRHEAQVAPPSRSRRAQALRGIWQVPLRRNPNFTGRDTMLAELERSLNEPGLLAIAALRGLGGVGKTQLALEYAYQHADDYDLVAWLRSETPETLAEDFAALAESLDLPERETPDQQRRIDAVRGWLERHDGWLVIFDNAPNPDAIRNFLPRTAMGHILVTSRHQSWRELGKNISVDELRPEEAVEFLLKRTEQTDAAMAAHLAEELGHLPLALEGAAAYMETTGRSMEAYLSLLRDQQKVLLAGPRPLDYPNTLGGSWEISFRQVESETPAAADVLRLCAFLAPEDVPFDLLRGAGEHLPADTAETLGHAIGFDECIAALRRYSLVKVEADSLSLHRLVQLVTRERLSNDEREQWAERALRTIEAGFPGSGMAGDIQPESGRLLPHALAALFHAESLTSCAVPAGRLLNRTGGYLSARGFHRQARKRLEQALTLLDGAGKDVENLVANLLNDLGLVLLPLGDPDRAFTLGERALEIHTRLRGSNHLRVALDLMNLAYTLSCAGKREHACTQISRAIPIVRATLGSGHQIEGFGLAVQSRALFECGEYREAREVADRAGEILGEQEAHHPLILNGWSNLAQVEAYFGNLDRAASSADWALGIGEAAYGADHPSIATTRVVRGEIEFQRGNLERARADFEAALLSGERTANRLHVDIAIARSRLGDVLRRLGETEQALGVLQHARQGVDRAWGDRVRLVGHAEIALAVLRAELGDGGEARYHARAALQALDASYPADHPFRIPALNGLASLDHAEGAAAAARTNAEQALASGAAAFGGRHPVLADSQAVLAALAAEAGDDAASRSHREQESLLRGLPGGQEPLTARWREPARR